jgi:hypothetical protein
MQIETDALEGKSASATKPSNTTSLPKFDVNMNIEDMEKMVRNSIEASNFFKSVRARRAFDDTLPSCDRREICD